MFHFWFNTFFVEDEESAVLEVSEAAGDVFSPVSSTKMNVTRTTSDQTRVFDRVVAEQRRLRKQLNNEILARGRRADSNDRLNMPPHSEVPSSHGLCRPKSDSKLSRHNQSAMTQFYDELTYGLRQSPARPRRRTYKVLRLCKCDIDRANKDKQHKLYPADFVVRCVVICTSK